MYKALLIEDHQAYAAILLKRISMHPNCSFEVTHSASLRSALAALAESKFDVVLLDLCLPDSLGRQTFMSVRAMAAEIPIVILTALDDEKLGMEAVRQGAQDYLVKGSIRAEELPRILQYAIERSQWQAQLRHESLNDPLTGLYNRRGFQILAEQQMKLAERRKKPMLILFVDVDGLKQINDQFGHSGGDQALRDVSRILQKTLRASDVISRFGGDEFAILAIDAGAEDSENLAGRLRARLAWENQRSCRGFRLSLSVGIAVFDPAQPCALEELIQSADRAMYENKRNHASLEKENTRQKPVKKNPTDILIVEDEPSISKPLARWLLSQGFKVTVAENGQEGLKKAKRHAPGLVVLDLMLPELSGEEVCKAIRLSEDERLAQTPIIMLTAKSSDVDRVLGRVIGANCYMTKPFHPDDLLEKIRRFTCVS